MLTELRDDKWKALLDLLQHYYSALSDQSVKPQVVPGSVYASLPEQLPDTPESFEKVLSDTRQLIMPALTHWQHPGFMALFPSNSSFPSLAGEVISSGVAINAMMWDTSPAATELEQRMMEWLRDLCGLPSHWQGVLQDTASTATLTAVIAAREKKTTHRVKNDGFSGLPKMILYTSEHAHYSVEKAAMSAGIGRNNVRKIQCNADLSMDTDALRMQVEADLQDGHLPFMVCATLGTTSTLAFDPLQEIAAVCNAFDLWLHVDAAYAGSAFILEEERGVMAGIGAADSYVFNPHKWLFTQFDCSAFYVSDPDDLLTVFSVSAEYLKATREQGIINYKDWGIPLGRRFRSLKLWYVLRTFGRKGLQDKISRHLELARTLQQRLTAMDGWIMPYPMHMNVLCLQYRPERLKTLAEWNEVTRNILDEINSDGRFYLTGTTVEEMFLIRIVPAQTEVSRDTIEALAELIEEITMRYA